MGLQPHTLSVPTGKYFWRLTRDGHLVSLRPAQMHRFWRGLPPRLDSVDAVYERASDHKIVFFKGGRTPTRRSARRAAGAWAMPREPCGLLGVETAHPRAQGLSVFTEHLLCPHTLVAMAAAGCATQAGVPPRARSRRLAPARDEGVRVRES